MIGWVRSLSPEAVDQWTLVCGAVLGWAGGKALVLWGCVLLDVDPGLRSRTRERAAS